MGMPFRHNSSYHLTLRFFLFLLGLSLFIILSMGSFFSWYFVNQLTKTFEQEAKIRLYTFEQHLNSFIMNETEELRGYHQVFAKSEELV